MVMQTAFQKIRGYLITGVLTAALAGCATSTQIAEQGVKSNLAVEDAANQITLLNVVRAMKRRPMYFTRFQSLKGPMGVGAPQFTLPIPFGPDYVTQIYNFSATQSFDKPNFDVQIMDTQKFLQGITKPVAPKTILYYLDQGWPQQMILHLFVREIETTDAKGNVVNSILNYPQNKVEFKRFQDAIAGLHGCDIVGSSVPDPVAYGPVLPIEKAQNLDHLVNTKNAELTLIAMNAKGEEVTKDNPGQVVGYQLMKISRIPTFKTVQSHRQNAAKCTPPGENANTDAMIFAKGQDSSSSKSNVRFVIRSPEAMIYYLGELARAQIEDGMPTPEVPIGFPRAGGKTEELFKIVRGTQDSEQSAVRVRYDGETYSIPATGAGRSMHAISLISQILNLQNEGGEVPGTATVRLAPN